MVEGAAHPPEETLVTRMRRWLRSDTIQGYLFWGPVVGAILIAEVLAAAAKWTDKHLGFSAHWPTISSTVGHFETLWPSTAAIVVAIIGAAAYFVFAVPRTKKTDRGWLLVRGGGIRPLPYYTALVPIVATVAAGAAAGAAGLHGLRLGYWIYGTLAVTGIVIPSLLVIAGFEAQFPTLFETLRRVEGRLHWVAVIVAAGLAILTIHLALYPWPDITKEPTQYAGLNANDARARAIVAVGALGKSAELKYSMQARGVDNDDQEAWLVFFTSRNGTGAFGGCIVAVKDTKTTPSSGCSQ